MKALVIGAAGKSGEALKNEALATSFIEAIDRLRKGL